MRASVSIGIAWVFTFIGPFVAGLAVADTSLVWFGFFHGANDAQKGWHLLVLMLYASAETSHFYT